MMRSILEGIFTPAVKLMGRLWYWQKFVLLTFLFTIPVGFALYSFITQIDKSISFTEKEIAGIQHVSPTLILLQHLQQHRGMVILYREDDQSFKTVLDEKEREITEDIARVDAEDRKSGIAFQSADKWNAIKEKWLALHGAYEGLTPIESFTRHTELISDVLALIHTLADNSNLILDSELSSYKIMNAVVNILPALTEDMGQARAFGLGVKDPKKLNDEERKEFINYAKIASIENTKLQDDMRDAFESDPSIRATLEKPLQEVDGAVKDFIGAVGDIVNEKGIPMSLLEYYAFMTRAVDAPFRFSERQADTLTGLLESRISLLRREKQTSIGITAASYLLILYFFIGFYLLVARTVRNFKSIAEQLVGGKTAEVLALSHDELGEAGKSFNVIGQKLILSNTETLRKAQELQKKSDEFERMNQFMIGRELKMVELKEQLKAIQLENDTLKRSGAG